MVKDRMDNTNAVARLNLRQTYMPKMPVDFAGHSSFGGKDDHLVVCAGKGGYRIFPAVTSIRIPSAGDIYIWDRDSAVLLHHINDQALDGDLTCIAWNGAVDNVFTFATGSHDGSVRVWATAPPEHADATVSVPQHPLADDYFSYERRANAISGIEGIAVWPFCRSPEPDDDATPLAF